jgi:hypothetical protein
VFDLQQLRALDVGGRGRGEQGVAVRDLLLGSPPSSASAQRSVCGIVGTHRTPRGPVGTPSIGTWSCERQLGDRRELLAARPVHLDRPRERRIG